ncbi:MAG: hypothetical protein HY330_02265 [Chloroflexi bacterium]|nr:hypothetical protein [Chloroflexota bacterium]
MADEPVFQVEDYQGHRITLTRRTFENHLRYRPEIAEYVEEAKQTLQDPDVTVTIESGGKWYYKAGLGRGRFRQTYLGVLVYDRGQNEGVVATIMLSRRLSEGIIEVRRWPVF